MLAITVVTYGLAFMVGIVMGIAGLSEEAVSFVGGLLGLTAQIIVAFVCVKRLHDLDKPGWHFWLLLLPLYNIYLSLVMLFVKGTHGTNQFGSDPLAS
jgi:uncharacterized membrane protein YhaH (DUF805 family)